MSLEILFLFIAAVKQTFPDVQESEIKQAIRQKCSNAIKGLKHKSDDAKKPTD